MPPKTLAERIDTLERMIDQLRLEMARMREEHKAAKPEKTKKQKATLEEVVEFCRSIDLPASDAEWFFAKCEGNGWKNGGKAILNWQQTIRAWKISKYLPSLKQNTTHNGSQKNQPSAPGNLNAGRYSRRAGA